MMPYDSAFNALATACQAISPFRIRVEGGLNRIAAASVHAPASVPSVPIALQDGWAVAAEETLGASPYAPAFASTVPRRVAYGDALPDGANAVLPVPGVVAGQNSFEILAPAALGENTRAKAGDLAEGETIVAAGTKLKMLHIAVLKLAGIENITIRIPRVRILSQCDPGSPLAGWLATAADREGAQSSTEHLRVPTADCLVRSLTESDADLIIAIGFQGMRDGVVRAVEGSGKMLFDSVAVRPGETICGGVLNQRRTPDCPDPAGPGSSVQTGLIPVLFIPGRMECVLAAWLLLVRPCLQRLAGASCHDVEERLPLARKIASMPGISELALVRRVAGPGDKAMLWEPLAVAEITLATIAHADAWLLVEASREGFAAGHSIDAKLMNGLVA